MIDAIVALLGAGVFLVIYNKFLKGYVESKQNQMGEKAEKINKQVNDLKKQNKDLDAKAKEQVKEIENEQNKEPSRDELVDFFNGRNRKH